VIPAKDSADPVALTESEPFTEDELLLQEPGRDLRPDTITPSPDLTSTDVASLEHIEEIVADEDLILADEEIASEATADEALTPTPAVKKDAASSGSTDEEKQDASTDAAN
jgi:hypothetical protein